MDTVTIVVLTVVITLLAAALAWYGPRRRDWRSHVPEGGEDRHPTDGESESTGEGSRE